MILSVVVPRLGDRTPGGTVHRLLARAGEPLRPGSPLFELRVDLGAARAQDCPPIVHFRILSTERGHLRAWTAAEGDALDAGAAVGLATSAPDEATDGPAARPLRTSSLVVQVDPLAG